MKKIIKNFTGHVYARGESRMFDGVVAFYVKMVNGKQLFKDVNGNKYYLVAHHNNL